MNLLLVPSFYLCDHVHELITWGKLASPIVCRYGPTYGNSSKFLHLGDNNVWKLSTYLHRMKTKPMLNNLNTGRLRRISKSHPSFHKIYSRIEKKKKPDWVSSAVQKIAVGKRQERPGISICRNIPYITYTFHFIIFWSSLISSIILLPLSKSMDKILKSHIKNKVGGLSFCNFKTYYKAVPSKTVWAPTYRSTELTWESRNKLLLYGPLIFDRSAKTM